MNQIKGGLYTLFLSYKRDFYIFTAINTMFLFLSLIMGMLFPDITIMTIGIVMVFIFTFIISMKVLDRSLAILLRYGLNRSRYIAVTGGFMLLWSLANAAVLFIINALLLFFTKQFDITSVTVPRLTMLYDDGLSLAVNYVMDASAIFMLAMAGMLTSVIFYRFGAIGGYSYFGVILALLFIGVPLKWYGPLVDGLLSWNAALFVGAMLAIAVVVLAIVWLLTRRVSTVSANV